MGVAGEIDHVEHGVGHGRGDVGHAHQPHEVEHGSEREGGAGGEAAGGDRAGDGVGGVGGARDDGHADDQRQNAEQDRMISCLREEHRKSQFHG